MKTSTNELKTERQWRSSTGYDEASFYNLLNLFRRTYFNIYSQTLPERQANGPKESEIKTEEDLLFFTLVAIKSGLTYDLLGLMFGMDGSSAFRNKDTGINILKSVLYEYGFAPARSFESIAEFEEYFKKYSTLIIDGEEQPIQRPSDEDSQKDNYSGKKRHTLKATVITGLSGSKSDKKILFLSYCYVGKTHDYRMLKEDFPPDQDWFKNFSIRLDSGYQGFDKDYICLNAYLPAKATKKHPLTGEQKLSNQELASQRIGIEHSIGRMKRYRVISDRLRMHNFERYDDVLEVCAGLWNFYVIN